MPAKRKLTMRQLRQMLRLAGDGASNREVARLLGVARSTVQENLKRAAPCRVISPTTRSRPGCSRGPGPSRACAVAPSPTGPAW